MHIAVSSWVDWLIVALFQKQWSATVTVTDTSTSYLHYGIHPPPSCLRSNGLWNDSLHIRLRSCCCSCSVKGQRGELWLLLLLLFPSPYPNASLDGRLFVLPLWVDCCVRRSKWVPSLPILFPFATCLDSLWWMTMSAAAAKCLFCHMGEGGASTTINHTVHCQERGKGCQRQACTLFACSFAIWYRAYPIWTNDCGYHRCIVLPPSPEARGR